VVIGETGSAFRDPKDKEWLRDFADFLNAEVRWEQMKLGPENQGVRQLCRSFSTRA
jgi:hypothetical protein